MSKSLSLAESDARKIINAWSAGAGLLGWIPGSTLFLAAADVKLVRDVAKAFGVENYSIEEVTAAIAASATGKGAAEFLSFIPIVGWAIKSVVAAGITKAVGEITISYFKERSPFK